MHELVSAYLNWLESLKKACPSKGSAGKGVLSAMGAVAESCGLRGIAAQVQLGNELKSLRHAKQFSRGLSRLEESDWRDKTMARLEQWLTTLGAMIERSGLSGNEAIGGILDGTLSVEEAIRLRR